MKNITSRFGAFSRWRPFPDPRLGGELVGPFGAGCYELRRSDTKELVLYGSSGHVCWRMTSLLPKPLGQGVRNNEEKRQYVFKHRSCIEYRTMACRSVVEARAAEARLLIENKYLFST